MCTLNWKKKELLKGDCQNQNMWKLKLMITVLKCYFLFQFFGVCELGTASIGSKWPFFLVKSFSCEDTS